MSRREKPSSEELLTKLLNQMQNIQKELDEIKSIISVQQESKPLKFTWKRVLIAMHRIGKNANRSEGNELVTTGEISSEIEITREVVSKYLNELEEENLVERKHSNHRDDVNRGYLWNIKRNNLGKSNQLIISESEDGR